MAELAGTLTVSEEERLYQAEALVRGYCGWHIAPSREETATVGSTGSGTLILKSLHVTAVESVTQDGVAASVEDYEWTEAGVIRHRSGYWLNEHATVVFTHGYDAVPTDVAAVVQAVAQRAFDNPGSQTRMQAGPFAGSPSLTGTGEAAAFALLDSEKQTLARYRLPRLA